MHSILQEVEIFYCNQNLSLQPVLIFLMEHLKISHKRDK